MKKDLLNENELNAIFELDSKGLAPHSSIKPRLLYYFQIKSISYTTRQNSFVGIANWLFSFKNMTVKATLASLIIAFSLINYQGNNPSTGQFLIDSLANETNAYADTAMLLPFYSDTCYLKL